MKKDIKMNAEFKIGMIGLDTSHAEIFTNLLNTPSHPLHVAGGKVVAGFPCSSPDFELSRSRVSLYTNKLCETFGVRILESPEAVAGQSDVLMLESADGRVHLDLFKRVASFGKPTFVDKPLAVSSRDARAILELAKKNNVPIMSSSALRYAAELTTVLKNTEQGTIIGAEFFGPMALQATQPGLFWHGIHIVEMLYAALGPGCVRVTAITNADHDAIVGEWKDGRLGILRGNRKGNSAFGGMVHREKGSQPVNVQADPMPFYANLVEQIIGMFRRKASPVDPAETLEIVRFIEAANESRETGRKAPL